MQGQCQRMGPRAYVLGNFALPYVDQLLSALADIEACSPFRNMMTPGGFMISVALTNCGALGWTTHRHGYRYTGIDPDGETSGTFLRFVKGVERPEFDRKRRSFIFGSRN
jgi:alkylated DNA repair dioxygenase AlkB